jgi:hypothetical protein
MKTLLITDAPVPERLREFITRGSTSFDQRHVADEASSAGMPDVDRIVFWSTGADAGLRQLASRYAQAEKAERKEAIVFVTTTPDDPVVGLSNTECFLWPQDEDRLRMAFLTGA